MKTTNTTLKPPSSLSSFLLSSKKNWVQLLASTLLVGAALIFAQNFYDLRFDFWLSQITQLNSSIIALALVGVCSQFYFQSMRCWVLFPQSIRPPLIETLRIFSRGQIINLVFPMRSGDFMKIALLNDLKTNEQSRVLELTGTLTSDKLIDILSLILALILFESPLHQIIRGIPQPNGFFLAGLGLIICVAFIATGRTERRWVFWIKAKASQFLKGCSGLRNPKALSFSLALGILSWSTEALILSQIAAFFGFPLSTGASLLGLAILNLGISIPISIANVGVFEASLAFGLSQASIPVENGMIIAAIHHFFQIAGVMTWFAMSFLFPKQKQMNQSPDTPLTKPEEFQVDSEAKGKALAYYNIISKSYDQRVRVGLLSYFRDREKKMILSMARLEKPAKTLIDVGCGGGYYSVLAKSAGFHVTSVDAAPGMIKALEGKVDQTYVSDIESLSTTQQYDRVLCLGVLDFVLNPQKSLSHLCQLVAPGGRLVLFVPRKGWAGWIYRLEKKQLGVKVNLYQPQWIKAQVERHGLILREIQYPLPTNMVLSFDRPQD